MLRQLSRRISPLRSLTSRVNDVSFRSLTRRSFSSWSEDESHRIGDLLFRPSAHNSVDIILDGSEHKSNSSLQSFKSSLSQAVDHWRKEGKNAVWLSLSIQDIELCKVASEVGFEFHNAKGTKAQMYLWLPEQVANKVPPFGFHQVGVGALVLNDKNEILLVKERVRRIDRWKMPGGLIDPSETVAKAVVREVFEETGVNAKFHSVLAFWQRTLTKETSDIYFVCRLTAIEAEDQMINIDSHEISECTWMPLKEYVEHHSHPMLLSVLNKNFGISQPEDLNKLLHQKGPLLPKAELALTQLIVSPTSDPFETFLLKSHPFNK